MVFCFSTKNTKSISSSLLRMFSSFPSLCEQEEKKEIDEEEEED